MTTTRKELLAQRNEEIVQLYMAGESLKVVGARYNITSSMVWLIVQQYKKTHPAVQIKTLTQRKTEHTLSVMREMAAYNYSTKEIAAKLGKSPRTINGHALNYDIDLWKTKGFSERTKAAIILLMQGKKDKEVQIALNYTNKESVSGLRYSVRKGKMVKAVLIECAKQAKIPYEQAVEIMARSQRIRDYDVKKVLAAIGD